MINTWIDLLDILYSKFLNLILYIIFHKWKVHTYSREQYVVIIYYSDFSPPHILHYFETWGIVYVIGATGPGKIGIQFSVCKFCWSDAGTYLRKRNQNLPFYPIIPDPPRSIVLVTNWVFTNRVIHFMKIILRLLKNLLVLTPERPWKIFKVQPDMS